jgi:hypothetical protein
MSAPRVYKRLAAEAIFTTSYRDGQWVGVYEPAKVAKLIEYADVANIRKWLVTWCSEQGIAYPKMRKGRKPTLRKSGAAIRQARYRANLKQGSGQASDGVPGDAATQLGAVEPTSTLPSWLDDLPIQLPWTADEGASVEELQRSFVLRARLRRLPLRDAYRAAGVPRHIADSWNDDSTPRTSGLQWSEEIDMAAALGLLGHVEAIAQFAERYPSNPKSVDLRSWLLERTAPEFVRKTAVAIGVQENIYVRDERVGSPAALLEGLAEIERRFNAARIVPKLPAQSELIDAEASEVEVENE